MRQISQTASAQGLKIEKVGSGRPLLLLHGGGGPATLRNFAEMIADDFEVLVATHPGFDGVDRPESIDTIRDLANAYGTLIASADIEGLIVMGFSMGGWLAAELAISHPTGISGLILADAVGIAVPDEAVLNVKNIPPAEIASYSYHRPEDFRIDPSRLSDTAMAAMQGNLAALAHYAKDHNLQDPELRPRLKHIKIPTLVLWGESDRVVTPAYGRAFADAIPGARYQLIGKCGHLPQLEQPDILKTALAQFAQALV